MDSREGALTPRNNLPDEDLEKALRPRALDEFIGQEKIKENLRIFLTAALQRGETLDHVLLSGPPGLGKCITGDSLVATGDGLVRMRELVPAGLAAGESAPLGITVHGVGGPERTSHVYASGRVPTRRLTTRAGFRLEGTPHHPVLAATPDGPCWKRLDALAPGDYVAVACGVDLWGEAHETTWAPDTPDERKHRTDVVVRQLHDRLARMLKRPPAGIELGRAYVAAHGGAAAPTPQRSARRLGLPLSDGRSVATVASLPRFDIDVPDGRPVEMNADMGYLLGAYVGDGHMEKRSGAPAFTITSAEPAMQTLVRRACTVVFGEAPNVQDNGERADCMRFSKRKGQVLADFGVSGANAAEKRVPAAVLRGPRAAVVGFLQGLFDADGHARTDGYIELTTRSERLGEEVQILLAQLGVIAYRSVRTVADAPCWRLFIGGIDAVRFYREVGFRLERKQAREKLLRDRERGATRSEGIPHAGPLLAALLRATGPHPRAMHKRFEHARRGDRVLGRRHVLRLLQTLPERAFERPEYAMLQALLDPNVRWDRVAAVEDSEAEAFDFVVPGTHSFVANGLYNHNTTLGYIIAEELGAGIKTTSGPVLDKPASIAGILTNLDEGDVLFIDEIHRLSPVVEEYLYSAMEDYSIDIVIDSGPNARSVKLSLPPFTLVGATTRKGLLTAPMRARFGIDFRYDYYTADLLQRIVLRSAGLLRVGITDDGALEIARRSRGTPRIANRLLRRTRDFAEVEGDGRVTRAIADRALAALDVDEYGLDDMDARILMTLIEKFGGGPTGLSNLAVSVGEDAGTIEEVYEPYLIQEGFLERTPRGRMASPRAYAHFGLEPPPRMKDLFEED